MRPTTASCRSDRGPRIVLFAAESDTCPVKGHLGVLLTVVLVAAGSLLAPASAMASPGPAGDCGAPSVTARPDADPPSLAVALPSSLGSEQVPPAAFTVDQDGALPVVSVRALKPAMLDLAIVLDTAADTPEPVLRRAKDVVTTLLDSLPSKVAVTVVSAGGTPEVVSPLGTDRTDAQDAVTDSPRGRGHAWLDGMVVAAGELPDAADRFAAVVVVTTGRDDASVRDAQDVRSLLEDRPVAVSLTSAGDPPAAPEWVDQCPAEVEAAQAAGAGELMARRLVDRYVVVAPAANLAAPLTVRVRDGAVDVTVATAVTAAQTRPADGAEVLGTKFGKARATEGGSALAPVTIALGLLAVLALALSVPALITGGMPGRLMQRSGGHRAAGGRPRHSEPVVDELRIDAWVARLCLLSIPAGALLFRLLGEDAAPSGLLGDGLVALGAVSIGVGAWWLWRSTAPPYPVWWWGRRVSPSGPRVTAAAPFLLALLPGALLVFFG